jgi:DNA-binding PadR family transcriptional regulator
MIKFMPMERHDLLKEVVRSELEKGPRKSYHLLKTADELYPDQRYGPTSTFRVLHELIDEGHIEEWVVERDARKRPEVVLFRLTDQGAKQSFEEGRIDEIQLMHLMQEREQYPIE